MQKGDEASPSIILTGRALLVKMLITLERHGLFESDLVYLCILTLYSHWYEKSDKASPSIIFAGLRLYLYIVNLVTCKKEEDPIKI